VAQTQEVSRRTGARLQQVFFMVERKNRQSKRAPVRTPPPPPMVEQVARFGLVLDQALDDLDDQISSFMLPPLLKV